MAWLFPVPLKREVDLECHQDSLELAIPDPQLRCYPGPRIAGVTESDDLIGERSIFLFLISRGLRWPGRSGRGEELEALRRSHAPQRAFGFPKELRNLTATHGLGQLGDLRCAGPGFGYLLSFGLARSRLGRLLLGSGCLCWGSGRSVKGSQLALSERACTDTLRGDIDFFLHQTSRIHRGGQKKEQDEIKGKPLSDTGGNANGGQRTEKRSLIYEKLRICRTG
ncbi:hypothetical protein GIB19_12520 [Pseudomonas sp. ITEM 17296]|uniref:hypothetical protein n=1 Tax=Pseudomonas sp. ITEM 17296 TaxID=2790281 RepID=UPI00237FDFEA|nr:hypothetical protein [Pseudomonas sp. ITEM 17296]MDE4538042.1 hypothetical protein [Pseudomonas sp. ITEM 17296]